MRKAEAEAGGEVTAGHGEDVLESRQQTNERPLHSIHLSWSKQNSKKSALFPPSQPLGAMPVHRALLEPAQYSDTINVLLRSEKQLLAASKGSLESFAYGARSLPRELAISTYQVFVGLQELSAVSLSQEDSVLPSVETCQHFSRIASLYRQKLLQHLGEANEESYGLWRVAYQIWYLAEILYFPQDGQGTGPVGEELLHWLNNIDPQPSRAEGLELAASSAPWEDEELFWSYLPRCLLRGLFKAAATLLSSLSVHPYPFVSRASQLISDLLRQIPRSNSFNYASDDFNRQAHLFRAKVQTVKQALENEFDDANRWNDADEDERISWYARFLPLLRLLAGEEEAVLEQAEDWREALCAWAVLVRPTLTRDDVPGTARRILDFIQLDNRIPGEDTLEALMVGNTLKAIQTANELSLWLATHLADLMDKMKLLDQDPLEEGSLRDWLLLRYADDLQSDNGLWRVVCHYLSYASAPGLARIRSILPTIAYTDPLSSIADQKSHQQQDDDEEQATTAEEVLEACYAYGLPDVANQICSDVAEQLLRAKEFGRATAYVVQGGDSARMCRITEMLVDEYIENGLSQFARLVDALPTNLLRPGATAAADFEDPFLAEDTPIDRRQPLLIEDTPRPPLEGVFAEQIGFLAQYRDFHAFLAQGQRLEAAKMLVGLFVSAIAPRRFWAVMIVDALPLLEDDAEVYLDSQDTFELLRCLEEITLHPNLDGSDPDQLLDGLGRIATKGRGKQKQLTQAAMQQLLIVRMALARNLSRSFLAGL